jgi:hypothetical protein
MAGIILGAWPSALGIRLTKCALRQASIPTMHDGSFSKAPVMANRLTFHRKAIFPSAPRPTKWKTSLPMSMPMDANGAAPVSILGFMAASPVHGC